MRKIEYYRYVPFGFPYIKYELLKPTGRWKIETGPSMNDWPELYIEHKTRWSTKWVHEDSIVLKDIYSCTINDCGVKQ